MLAHKKMMHDSYKGLAGLLLIIGGVIWGIFTYKGDKGYVSMIVAVLAVVIGGYMLLDWHKAKNTSHIHTQFGNKKH